MKPTTKLHIGMYVTGLLLIFCCALVTMEAVTQRNYYQHKYLNIIKVKDAEILNLKHELNKAQVFNDWHLIWEYVLPEIKRNEMYKEVSQISFKLKEYKEEKNDR